LLEVIIFALIIIILGVLPSIWYLKRKEKPAEVNQKPNIIIVILGSILLIVNTYFTYILNEGSIAYVFGAVYFIPIVLILIFNENWNKRWKIILFTQFIIFLSVLGNLMSVAQEVAKTQGT